MTDPAGRVTGFEVDGSGDLVKITDPDGSERLFAYDARHLLISQTSKRGFETTYDYGFHGRNLQANRPDLSTRKVAPAEVMCLIDPAAGQGSEADPAPYLRPSQVVASFTDGNDNTTSYELGPFGGATRITDALGRMTQIARDGDGQALQVTHPNGRVDQMTYDARGNLLRAAPKPSARALKRTTGFQYEPAFNQVTKITDPEQNETLFAYDASGNLTAITDAHLTVTALSYGDANCPGLVTTVTRAQGLAEQATSNVSYDPVTCNQAQASDPLSNATSLLYDGAGNLIQLTRRRAAGQPLSGRRAQQAHQDHRSDQRPARPGLRHGRCDLSRLRTTAATWTR